MPDLDSRLSDTTAEIARRDDELRAELDAVRRSARAHEEARAATEAAVQAGELESLSSGLALETVVLRVGRPVLQLLRDEAQVIITEPESEVWRGRLIAARQPLVAAARATGRIEVEGHPRLDWIGTGWLVDADVVATNRHVAREFSRRGGSGFVFRRAMDGSEMQVDIDFLEEFGRGEPSAFWIREVLHVEDDDGPDLAFLRVDPAGDGALATPLPLAADDAERGEHVAVIGYPARDSRIPDQTLVQRIFGDVYDKKRLAPGEVMGFRDGLLLHDCSTLGGVSGAAVCSLRTGEVVGLHFAGRFLEANFAVPARVVAERLDDLRGGGVPSRGRPPEVRGDAARRGPDRPDIVASVTIPIHLTIDVGAPITAPGGGGPVPPRRRVAAPATPADGEGEEDLITEGVPEDYADREGYQAQFLGDGNEVPLPVVGGDREDDVLRFGGQREHVLRYEHFSVVMSRSRRMCFFSAVNIDGSRSRRNVERVGWRTDPRIPARAQIKGECYGNSPKFSRGHMTRREDPVWGDSAGRGNADSMSVTNAVPQMQPFNAGIWLDLEDYALDHARKDSMRISVFTGPYLHDRDPDRYGVKIPVRFWKVIAFIHDETGKLSATGYALSQEDFLREEERVANRFTGEEEFVYGQHRTAQVSIASIEAETGLSFGTLASLDPLGRDTEAVEEARGGLARLDDIRFF